MSMNNGNTPEVVVITGAAAGVGRATAQAFARRGAHVGLIDQGEPAWTGWKGQNGTSKR